MVLPKCRNFNLPKNMTVLKGVIIVGAIASTHQLCLQSRLYHRLCNFQATCTIPPQQLGHPSSKNIAACMSICLVPLEFHTGVLKHFSHTVFHVLQCSKDECIESYGNREQGGNKASADDNGSSSNFQPFAPVASPSATSGSKISGSSTDIAVCVQSQGSDATCSATDADTMESYAVYPLHLISVCQGKSSGQTGRSQVINVYTDASGRYGLGCIWDKKWIVSQWEQGWLSHCKFNMELLEMKAVLVAIMTWGHLWRGSHVRFHCDNAMVVNYFRKCKRPQQKVQSLYERIALCAANYDFNLVLEQANKSSVQFQASDSLSRFDFARFNKLMPCMNAIPDLPPKDLSFLSPEFWEHACVSAKLRTVSHKDVMR